MIEVRPLAGREGAHDADWAAGGRAAAGFAGAAPPGGGASEHASADGPLERPRLLRSPDRADLRGRRGRGAHLAPSLPAAGPGWIGGPSPAGQTAARPSG